MVLVALLMVRQRTLRLYTQGAFLALFITVAACLFLDIASVLTINYIDTVGPVLNSIICKAYLGSITLVAFMLFYYTFMEIHRSYRNLKAFIAVGLAPFGLEILVLSVFPIYIQRLDKAVYTYGACVSMTYAVALLYLIISMFYTIYYKDRMAKSVRKAVWFLEGAWFITAVIQMFNNELLLVGFAMCMAMVYMYVTLENPQAYIDRETAVYNAYAYTSYVDKKLSHGQKIWAAAVQVEGLRFVNENIGVKNGGRALVKIAEFFSSLAEGRVKVFRISEDSFALLLDNEDDMEIAVENIISRFKQPWEVQGMNINLDMVIAYLPDSSLAAHGEELVEIIHYFLWESSRHALGTIIRIDEAQLAKRNKVIEAEKTLRWALLNNKVEVYYQPIYSVELGRFSTMEALVRIVDEKKQFVMPDVFIPIAEQNGMILELGLQVFEKTCLFMQQERLEELGIEYIDINLSVVQCMQQELAQQLLDIMEKYHISPSRINLEITETAAVHSEKVLLGNMERLNGAGTTFSLDDYGTGYSNLSYIVNLPIHIIKLDKSMIGVYFTNEKVAIATRNVIAMIKEMGLRIVAEGVENAEQFHIMEQLGVDYIQGFYFSRPLPRQKALAFLEENGKRTEK